MTIARQDRNKALRKTLDHALELNLEVESIVIEESRCFF